MEDLEIDAFLHCNDLTYLNNGEEELQKYKKGDKLKVKVLEIKTSGGRTLKSLSGFAEGAI